MEVRCYRITGIVQGVGFRPFIHKLAAKYQTNGWILNDSDGVLMEIDGEKETLENFINEVATNYPPLAMIEKIIRIPTNTPHGTYMNFEIRRSITLSQTATLISPDSNVCDDCLRELFDEADRRYKYPFINCTNCGPRYSIIQSMPYDRAKTTMKDFVMCQKCGREYQSIDNRRYHAQPNACPVCGPELMLADKQGEILKVTDIISFSQEKLLEGKIFAIKSIGGFHLVVDAQNDEAVRELRRRKKRDSKPFAIMAKDIEIAQRFVHVNIDEAKILHSVQRPIVILKKKEGVLPNSIAPNNPNYGLMLPSAPLHYLLLDNERLQVLIMTSGNISGNPICFSNEEALKMLNTIVDYYILNNRDIHTRVDDSIVRCTSLAPTNETVTTHIRRSRGFAPYPITINSTVKQVLALGSELKATIALSKNNQVFISHHIGDIKNDSTFQSLNDCAHHLQNLLSIKPQYIACDSHPSFRSTVTYLQQKDLPVTLVQHHHAHMASCMAENKLDTQVIGVIFDGTGYGLDGTIWGGEFLVGDYADFQRAGHLRPFYLLGGDKAVEEPFRVAIDLLFRTYGDSLFEYPLDFLKQFKGSELNVYSKMAKNKINSFATTSMGRLFDGVSALLNICLKIEYEAQAAIEMESLLNRTFYLEKPFSYEITYNGNCLEVDYRQIINEIVNEILSGCYRTEYLSRRFHSTIVDIVAQMCIRLREKYSLNDVVLSGGVFMNEYLLVNTISTLRGKKFNVHYHKLVPSNDGGISLGQIVIADAKINTSDIGGAL